MIGAEPPALERHAPRAGATWCWTSATWLDLPRGSTTSASIWRTTSTCSVRAGEVVGIAGVSGNGQKRTALRAVGRGHSARRAAIHLEPGGACAAGHLPPAPAPRAGPALRARRAPGPRRGALDQPGAQPAADAATTRWARLGWLRTGRNCRRACRQALDRALQRQGQRRRARPARSLSGGNLQKYIMGREIDAQPEAAGRLAADLGRGRGCGGADPRRDPGPARCGLRRAGVQRRTR
jgi:ABC-type uncharacterized transport system ATPase subunit